MKSISVLIAMLCIGTVVHGQTSFNTTAGGDQIYNAYGLQTEYKWHKLSGWIGVGYSNGLKVGGYLQIPLKTGESNNGYHLGIGDQRLSALLDTDEYDSHAFSVRGVSFVNRSANSNMQMFSGLLSQEVIQPYMRTSYVSGTSLQPTPLAAMMYKHQLSKTLQFHSLNIMNGKVTSIESLGWNPSRTWKFAGATGIGSGAGYLAASGELHKKRMDLRASYTIAGKDFQRQEQPYYSTESIGLNYRATVTPINALQLSFDHEKSQTVITGIPAVTETTDTADLSIDVLGFQLSPSISTFTANDIVGRTNTERISASRRICARWRAFGTYIKMDSPLFKQKTFVAINEFRVNPKLTLRQNYNHVDGQNNFSFGGQWSSNLLSLSVDQQVYFSPIAVAFGGKSVFQAWTFSLRMRAPHGTHANVNTIVTPDNKVQWGGYLSGLRYDSIGPMHSTELLFSKYSIHGTVMDENGKGVWGVAIQIGQDTVLSDEVGVFYLDVKNAKPMPMSVAKALSIQPLFWQLTSAPSIAQGQKETDTKSTIQILVNTTRPTSI